MIEVEKLHTTPLGEERIRRNLSLSGDEVVMDVCRNLVENVSSTIYRKGKNCYVENGNMRLTINANSHTVITAHKIK